MADAYSHNALAHISIENTAGAYRTRPNLVYIHVRDIFNLHQEAKWKTCSITSECEVVLLGEVAAAVIANKQRGVIYPPPPITSNLGNKTRCPKEITVTGLPRLGNFKIVKFVGNEVAKFAKIDNSPRQKNWYVVPNFDENFFFSLIPFTTW